MYFTKKLKSRAFVSHYPPRIHFTLPTTYVLHLRFPLAAGSLYILLSADRESVAVVLFIVLERAAHFFRELLFEIDR